MKTGETENWAKKEKNGLWGIPWGSFLRLLFFFGLCQFKAGGPIRRSYDNHAGPPRFFWKKTGFGWFHYVAPGLRKLFIEARIFVNPRDPRPSSPDARKRRKRPSGAKRGMKRQNCQGFCAVILRRQLRFAPPNQIGNQKKGKTKRCDEINWEGRNCLFRGKYFSNPA